MKALFVPYGTAVEWEDAYVWQRNLGSYLDGIANFFEDVSIVCHVTGAGDSTFFENARPIFTYTMKADNIRVIPFSGNQTVREFRALSKRLDSAIADADFTYVFVPSFKSLLAARKVAMVGKAYAVYIGSDWRDVARFIMPSSIPRVLWPAVKWWIGREESQVVHGASFVVAHGARLLERYGREDGSAVGVVPILNWGTDRFHIRADTCGGNEMHCLFVGTISPRKGMAQLLRGLARARTIGVPARLSIIGKGTAQAEADVRDMIAALKIHDHVDLIGYVSDPDRLIEAYRGADAFVLPTLGEGFPRVIYEAMSQSVPVITTSTGSLPDVLTSDQTALLVPAASADAIADALQRIWKEPTLRRRLISGGRELAAAAMGDDPAQQFERLLERYVQQDEGRGNA